MKSLFATLILVALGTPVLAKDSPKLRILNAAPNAVETFWLSPDGRRVPNGTLPPGEDRIIETTLGHRFRIADGEKGAEILCQVPVQCYRYDPEAKQGIAVRSPRAR